MRNYGLVLCGGGGRGSYQIGVWKAMNELGFTQKIAAVSGTSVGALNAALFASGTAEQAEEIWCSLRTSDLMDYMAVIKYIHGNIVKKKLDVTENIHDIFNHVVSENGIFSREGLRRIIESNNICRKVMNAGIPVYACYKNVSDIAADGKVVYSNMKNCRTEEEVIEILFASSCLPVIFKSGKINGHNTLDGGFLGDNIPVEPLYRNLNLRKFIVIGLDPKKDYNGRTEYKDAEFIYIKPSENIYLGASGKPVIGDGLTDFNGSHAAERIKLGYGEGYSQLIRGMYLLK